MYYPGCLRRLLRRRARDYPLAAEAALLLLAVRLALWALPSRASTRLVVFATKELVRNPASRYAETADHVVQIVEAMGRLMSVTNCLVRALTTWIILMRRRIPARLRIGVTRGPAGRLEAHAWLESRGRVVIGDAGELSRYVRIS